jgi:cyclophilin family peptidyl-prolyl cis-trans isomerase
MKFVQLISFVFITMILFSCKKEDTLVIVETEYGAIKMKLYDSTPKHRDNFIKLIKEGYYNDLLFHRVIKNFVIQGGDPDSKNATPEALLGNGGPDYTIPAEIGALHYRGALAAARKGDSENPEKASSGSQFYIVQGGLLKEDDIKLTGNTYTQEQINQYLKVGGTPDLDGKYTVFGEFVEGMEVVDSIANTQIGVASRPLKDIKMKIKIVE